MPTLASPRASRGPSAEPSPSSRATARPWRPSSPLRTSTPSKTPSTGTSPGKPTVTWQEIPTRRLTACPRSSPRSSRKSPAKAPREVRVPVAGEGCQAATGHPPARRAYDLASAYAARRRSAPPGCQRQETLRVRRPLPPPRRGLPRHLRGRGRSDPDPGRRGGASPGDLPGNVLRTEANASRTRLTGCAQAGLPTAVAAPSRLLNPSPDRSYRFLTFPTILGTGERLFPRPGRLPGGPVGRAVRRRRPHPVRAGAVT